MHLEFLRESTLLIWGFYYMKRIVTPLSTEVLKGLHCSQYCIGFLWDNWFGIDITRVENSKMAWELLPQVTGFQETPSLWSALNYL